ncbi:zinc finger protein 271 [Plutella xylostella]|uniref:zinc finger protein 271 n=1 Tax=Plutella xylostella TaxID=51655 RepID=UPI00203319D7|nr:zinc finger protein 271 [Plutella xylostella]
MTQFNLELDHKHKPNKTIDCFKTQNEESFDFEVIEDLDGKDNYEFEIIDSVIENKNVSEENIKDVLLDLDSIGLQSKSTQNDSYDKECLKRKNFNSSNDYIDDEYLIDELCREDSDCRLTPDIFQDEYLSTTTSETNTLPSMETAFSKKYCNYNKDDYTLPLEETSQDFNSHAQHNAMVPNLDYYSYPNNILCNLEGENNYILPDTPTSCTEFNYDRNERKVSVSESIESDAHSSNYYDDTSEAFDDDDLFINLDDFGLTFQGDNSVNADDSAVPQTRSRNSDNEKVQGERVCQWEGCYERYPSQSTLVEHIERSHVNTYKGDEFSCLWRGCARARRPFNARYKLLIHMRVHSGHKPNRCHHPGCGKAFSRLENLKIHVRSHTGERPYACPAPHCRKAFSNSSDRAKHQRTHFNARPYACGAVGCGKRYTDPSSLRKHVKCHPHAAAPRACLAPARAPRPPPGPAASPAKLATLRCIRDKLAVPRLQRL